MCPTTQFTGTCSYKQFSRKNVFVNTGPELPVLKLLRQDRTSARKKEKKPTNYSGTLKDVTLNLKFMLIHVKKQTMQSKAKAVIHARKRPDEKNTVRSLAVP